MNILPHKSWHVRTKANIAKVRRDEAKAAEEEKERQRRINLAEQEARINILRKKSKTSQQSDEEHTIHEPKKEELESRLATGEHINFFADLEQGITSVKKENPEYIQEKKEAQEKYEKQIGYLTYLGQDTNEALGKKEWYEKLADRRSPYNERGTKIEVGLNRKRELDPLNAMKKYLNHSSNKTPKIDSGTTTSTIQATTICTGYKSSAANCYQSTKLHKTKKLKKKEKKKHKKSSKYKYRPKSTKEKLQNYKTDREEDSSEKSQKLQKLRAERLKREQLEKSRSEALLKTIYGEPSTKSSGTLRAAVPKVQIKQKYNSQFNPELAKQNYEDYK